jgi:hypothetical protein
VTTKDLLAHQAQNRERTIKCVSQAMADIEREIGRDGYYQENGGRITAKEVCRRAGVGYSTLKNPAHEATRAKLRAWLERLKKAAPTATFDADMIKGQRARDLVQQLETVAHKYNRFKIEYDAILEKVAALEYANAELNTIKGRLEREVAALRMRVDLLGRGNAHDTEANVIAFPKAADEAY